MAYATDERKEEQTKYEMSGTLSESGHQIASFMQSHSRERPQNASKTFDMDDKESEDYEDHEICKITFLVALAKDKGMLEKLTDQVILIKLRTKDRKPPPLLEKEEVEKLHQQFHYVRRIRPDKRETKQWRLFEPYHDEVVRLASLIAEGYIFTGMLENVNIIIEDMLERLDAMR